MVSKRISAVMMLLILITLSVSCVVRGNLLGIAFLPQGEAAPSSIDGLLATTEGYLKKAVPLARTLKAAKINLRYLLGEREQDNVFITGSRLIENVQPPNSKTVQKNMDAILDFTDRLGRPSYAMLIPTASAVLQSEIPKFADIYNQKRFIENVYNNFAGKLSCVDVYSTLFEHSDQYIYYNTESLLTPQGGYLVYDMLTRRMGDAPLSLDRFEIKYLGEYYGELYDRVECKNVDPDVLSIYPYSGGGKEFTVTHYSEKTRRYETLYPEHLLALGRPMDVFLGGLSPVVDIRQKQRAQKSLLVFGDKQMLSVLPFLACGYQQVTLIDLGQITPQQLSEQDFGSYDEVLFAYSTDTFMHSDTPARVGLY